MAISGCHWELSQGLSHQAENNLKNALSYFKEMIYEVLKPQIVRV